MPAPAPLLVSGTRTTSGSLALDTAFPLIPKLSRVVSAVFELSITAAAAAAGDTLNVYVQHSVDGGATWDDFVSFTQALGNGGPQRFIAQWTRDVVPNNPLHAGSDGALAAGVNQGAIGSDWRAKWVIAGSTPSFTFELWAHTNLVD
jgi:hypothetical protein